MSAGYRVILTRRALRTTNGQPAPVVRVIHDKGLRPEHGRFLVQERAPAGHWVDIHWPLTREEAVAQAEAVYDRNWENRA